MKIKRVELNPTDSFKNPTEDIKNLHVSNFLIRRQEILKFDTSDTSFEMMRKLIQDYSTREFLIAALGDLDAITKVVGKAHFAKEQIIIGSTNCSVESTYRAVLSVFKDAKGEHAALLSALLVNVSRLYGNLISGGDWVYMSQVKNLKKQDGVTSVIVENLALKAIAAIPKRGRELSGRIPISLWAQNIIEMYRGFISELMHLNAFVNDMHSFLARLRTYLLDTHMSTYGDQAQIFLTNDNFTYLSQNYTLIKMALENERVASHPTVWNLEDARIAEAIRGIDSSYGLDLVTKSELVKMFDMTRFDNVKGGAGQIFVFPSFPKAQEMRVYRELKSGGLRIFYGDSRLSSLTVPFSKVDDMVGSAIKSMTSLVCDLQSETEIPGVVKIDEHWGDQDLYEYLAVSLADGVAINKGSSNDIRFIINPERVVRTGIYIERVVNEGMTDNVDVVLALCAQDVHSTYTESGFDVMLESEKTKYMEIPEHTLTYLTKGELRANLSYKINKTQQKVQIEINPLQHLYGIEKGNYVITGFKSYELKIQFISAVIDFLDQYISDRVDDKDGDKIRLLDHRLQDLAYKLYSTNPATNALVLSSLWKVAKDRNLATDSVYNDALIGLSIREISMSLFLKLFGVELHKTLETILRRNAFAFSDLGKI